MKTGGLLTTRRSLVDRLADWDDRERWQEFFETYWKLIYSAARKSGLTDPEAQEVLQETVITVAKNIDKLKYDPAIGSFKVKFNVYGFAQMARAQSCALIGPSNDLRFLSDKFRQMLFYMSAARCSDSSAPALSLKTLTDEPSPSKRTSTRRFQGVVAR